MKQWFKTPLALVANLPLIVLALRWGWVSTLRLVGQQPAKLSVDSQVMLIVVGVACFALNVYNLVLIYQQDVEVVCQKNYRPLSWALALVMMSALVICWAKPEELINPQRVSLVLLVATALLFGQALLGNYFLATTTTQPADQPQLSLTLPTLTWLVAGMASWPWQFQSWGSSFVAGVIFGGLLYWHLHNWWRVMHGDGDRYQSCAVGIMLASLLAVLAFAFYASWTVLANGWWDLIDQLLVVSLVALAASSQFCACWPRRQAFNQPLQRKLIFWSAVLFVLVEFVVAGLVIEFNV